MDFKRLFEYLVEQTANYIVENNLSSVVLGVSGGIDSTVCAAICHEVSNVLGDKCKFYGRSLSIKNFNRREYKDEFYASVKVGETFCDNFAVINFIGSYEALLGDIVEHEENVMAKGVPYNQIEEKSENQTPIANGNLQARLRMAYLYNLAGIHNGIVIDTDNLSEHYLGFFTLHGDQGDFNPIGGLWKTEVYELAEYLIEYYKEKYANSGKESDKHKYEAIERSRSLNPTDGLGISNTDLEQIGAKSYKEVDDILQHIVYIDVFDKESEVIGKLSNVYGSETVNNVVERYKKSAFKRRHMPIVVHTNDTDFGTIESICNHD